MNKFRNDYIPLGMYRSVERNKSKKMHPVRDASLTGCNRTLINISTERCIPNGMRLSKFKLLQVIYFSCFNKKLFSLRYISYQPKPVQSHNFINPGL
jgi:hypothetical protein